MERVANEICRLEAVQLQRRRLSLRLYCSAAHVHLSHLLSYTSNACWLSRIRRTRGLVTRGTATICRLTIGSLGCTRLGAWLWCVSVGGLLTVRNRSGCGLLIALLLLHLWLLRVTASVLLLGCLCSIRRSSGRLPAQVDICAGTNVKGLASISSSLRSACSRTSLLLLWLRIVLFTLSLIMLALGPITLRSRHVKSTKLDVLGLE